MDNNGCTYSETITITGSPPIVLSLDVDLAHQQVEVNVEGGTPPYLYLWSTTDTDSITSLSVTGLYSVTITDANGCTALIS